MAAPHVGLQSWLDVAWLPLDGINGITLRCLSYLGLPRLYLVRPHKEAIRSLTADLQRALGDVVDESPAEMSPPRAPVSHG